MTKKTFALTYTKRLCGGIEFLEFHQLDSLKEMETLMSQEKMGQFLSPPLRSPEEVEGFLLGLDHKYALDNFHALTNNPAYMEAKMASLAEPFDFNEGVVRAMVPNWTPRTKGAVDDELQSNV